MRELYTYVNIYKRVIREYIQTCIKCTVNVRARLQLLEVLRISVVMSYDCYVLCSLQGSGDARFISAMKSILYSVVPHLVRECESTLY